jgi:hypothetical protein
MKKQYRIVRDRFGGFEAQYKPRWWPFWRQCSQFGPGAGVNTHCSLSDAVEFAKWHAAGAVVQHLEIDA